MNLSWDPTSDESTAVAIAREVKKPSNYKIAYLNPPASDHETPSAATAYVTSSLPSSLGTHSSMNFGSPVLSLPPNQSYAFEPLPAIGEEGKPKREVYLVTGPSGSGKSHWMRAYANNYMKIYPKNNVYLLSSLQYDDTLDAIKELKRIDLDKLVATPPKDVKTWANSLVIIDDIEGLDKVKADAVYRVQDMIASEGRHHHVSLLRASHLTTDYKRTRLILQEAQGFVIYPQAGAHSQYMYLLTKYAGMDKKVAAAFLQMPTRWLMIHHTQPRFTLTASQVAVFSPHPGM
jgi:energy-coupling factor transporter ATP-binding protein EcfA2